MNVMMLQALQYMPSSPKSHSSLSNTKTENFHDLLANTFSESNGLSMDKDIGLILTEKLVNEKVPEELLQFLQETGLYDSLMKQVQMVLSSSVEDNDTLVHIEESIAELNVEQLAYQILADHDYFRAYVDKLVSSNNPSLTKDVAQETGKINLLTPKQIQLTAMELLQNVSNKGDVHVIAPKIASLLEQWYQQLNNQQMKLQSTQHTQSLMFTQINAANELELDGIWSKLLQISDQYNQQKNVPKITSTDVSQWLSKLIDLDKPVTYTSMNQSVPISKLEQFYIHLNSNSVNQTQEQQMIDKFKQIIQSNKLQNFWNGSSGLSIKLSPDQLGDMTIRMAQINGEMTVKILVSSMAAKEMLDSNLHQLRNIFSPHQVIIEKQDVSMSATNLQESKDSTDDQLKEQMNGSNQQTDEDEKDAGTYDFEEFMAELLNEQI
ncbi:flagellar hook-length control protein FliK [Oceanobacillus sp. 1P07AA]|uniref:flagellar hook-length control protein FliK n=1 Tax=Oceanobacillus sp. 1P07AA TaxID=3132293 RepID=UPI0039A49B09